MFNRLNAYVKLNSSQMFARFLQSKGNLNGNEQKWQVPICRASAQNSYRRMDGQTDLWGTMKFLVTAGVEEQGVQAGQ